MIFRKLLTNGEIMLIIIIALCTAINPANDTAVRYDLPDIIPLHYDAKIRFNYKTNDIIGECNITIRINHQTEKITLHPVIFAIIKIVLYDNPFSKKMYVPKYLFDNELNMLMIDLTTSKYLLQPGRYTLKIIYIRHINNNKKYFQSLYFIKKLDTMLITTGVDIMTARQLFPCWDKIAYNSTFKISIKHHTNYSALSNMPIQRTEIDDNRDMIWTHFEKSPLMLIQQIKVVITSFTNNSTSIANITFWSRDNVTYYIYLAKCIAQQVLYFLKHENSIDKLPKVDYVAFWDTQHNIVKTQGLILHREADIIYNGDLDPIRHKIKVARLITYQIISLWYDDVLLWSKRSFFKLLSTFILRQIFPDYSIMDLFIVETQRESFLSNTPSNANEMNSLSYLPRHIKSSNVWRMLYHFITADVFWTSIRTYATSNLYHQTNDLEDIIQIVLNRYPENSNLFIIKEFIAFWMEKNYYYPILYVNQYNFTNIIKFQYLTTDPIQKDRKHIPIFVTYTTKSIMNFQEIFANKFWLSSQTSVKILKNFDENDWIIVNLQQTGYYRVNYNTANWRKLAQYMNSTKYIDIHVLNRAQIIDDAFHFFIHKQLDFITFWETSEFLSRETDYVVWYPMFKAFEYLTLKISIKSAKNIKEKMEKILSGVLQKISYNARRDESGFTKCLREEAVKWACIIDNKECRKEAINQIIRELQRSENDTFVTRSASWEAWMYSNGDASINETISYDVFNKLIKTNGSNHLFLEHLTGFKNLRFIKGYLQLLTEKEFSIRIDRNKHVHIFLLITAKHAGNDTVYNFILERLHIHIYMYSTSNTRLYQIAIFIVIITHQHAVVQLNQVLKFATTYLREKRLVDAVKKKIKKRRDEYGRKTTNYGFIGLPRKRDMPLEPGHQ